LKEDDLSVENRFRALCSRANGEKIDIADWDTSIANYCINLNNLLNTSACEQNDEAIRTERYDFGVCAQGNGYVDASYPERSIRDLDHYDLELWTQLKFAEEKAKNLAYVVAPGGVMGVARPRQDSVNRNQLAAFFLKERIWRNPLLQYNLPGESMGIHPNFRREHPLEMWAFRHGGRIEEWVLLSSELHRLIQHVWQVERLLDMGHLPPRYFCPNGPEWSKLIQLFEDWTK
jgi:hypothetical protein